LGKYFFTIGAVLKFVFCRRHIASGKDEKGAKLNLSLGARDAPEAVEERAALVALHLLPLLGVAVQVAFESKL
jgi:hypothetical protein